MIGRLHHVVIDCRDPAALASFYSELLSLPVTYQADDWVVIAENESTSSHQCRRPFAAKNQADNATRPDSRTSGC